MRSIVIPKDISQHDKPLGSLKERLAFIFAGIKKLQGTNPIASIIIPAYNEEANILKTLSSLSMSSTIKKVEIIVVDNNSTDDTVQLANAAGAVCIEERVQGITAARNAGLQHASGRYILNADADTIYPPQWIDRMLQPLLDEKVGMVYGKFSFLPSPGQSRLIFTGYEYVSDFSKWINKHFREEAVNIYGFNSAFRRMEGLAVSGFDHPQGTNEDGWLGIKLKSRFHKSLFGVTDRNAVAWTSDRRIQLDGGIFKAAVKRLRRHLE